MKKRTPFGLLILLSMLIFSANLATGAAPVLRHVGIISDYGLVAPSALAQDPTGTHVYVLSYGGGGAISLFERDALTGDLRFVAKYQEGEGGVQGLGGARAVTVSPDGRSVYAAGSDDDALVVFERNTTSGQLTHLESFDNAGVGALDGATDVMVDAAGSSVYVAAEISDAVAHFSRDTTTGRLTFQGARFDETIAVPDGLDGARSLALSLDGKHLYVGSVQDSAVVIFDRSVAGSLTYLSRVEHGAGGIEHMDLISDLALSPAGNHLYVCATNSHAVNIFGRDASSGELAYQGVVQKDTGALSGMAAPLSLALSPNGSQLYVGSSSALHTFQRNAASGQLTLSAALEREGTGSPELGTVLDLLASPDSKTVLSLSGGSGTLGIYRRDLVSGHLALQRLIYSYEGLDGVVGVAVARGGERVFVASTIDDSLLILLRNSQTGMLDNGRLLQDGYGTTRGLDGARDVVVTGDGRDVYVAGYDSDAVAHFRKRDTGNAYDYRDRVADSQPGVLALDGPQALALSPDERYVYVAAAAGDALIILERDTDTGQLSFVLAAIDNLGTNDYLDGAYDLAVSPDGQHVYVASIEEDAVAHYELDPGGGPPELKSAVVDGTGAFGLKGANGLAVSPDGRHVLAAGRQSGAVAVLSVDPNHGTLSFHAMWDYDDVAELAGARAVVVSPDGRRVYVAGQYAHGIAAFARDPETGDLTFVEAKVDGVDGVDGLDTANGLAISADGRHLYVAGYGDSALSIFGTRVNVYLPLVLR